MISLPLEAYLIDWESSLETFRLRGTLNYVRLYTQDLSQARHFYTQTLGMDEMAYSSQQAYLILKTPGANLVIEGPSTQVPLKHIQSQVGRHTGLSITVKDVFVSYHQLVQRGVQFLSEPKPQSWGGFEVCFEDLDKNVLTLVG